MKVSRVLHFLVVTGRLFHKVDSDRRELVGWYATTSSSKYWVAVPWSAVKVYIKIFYCDLYKTGSQCREFKTGVVSSLLWVRVTSRQKNSVLSVAVSSVSLEDHTGERCRNLAEMLSGRVPVFCKHPMWCTTWYDQYYEFGNNRLWILHLLASPWSEMYQNILLSSSLTMLQKRYYYLPEAVIPHLSYLMFWVKDNELCLFLV